MQSRYEIIRKPESPTTSIFIPFTREWNVKNFWESFEKVIIPKSECELICYIDSDSEYLWNELYAYLSSDMNRLWNGVKLYRSKQPAPQETNPMKRRERIVEMKNHSRTLIDPDSLFVFGVEDDTIVPPLAFIRLFKTIQLKNVGFVEGVQCGRWNWKIIGAWIMDDVHNPQVVETLWPRQKTLSNIDGGGFYCYMTKAELYREIEYRVEAECLGVDVCYCMDVRRKGFRAYVDWAVVCGHQDHNRVLLPDKDVIKVRFKKEGENWTHELIYNNGKA